MKAFESRNFFEKIIYVGNRDNQYKSLVIFGISIIVKRHLHILMQRIKYNRLCRRYFGPWISCLRIAEILPLKVGILYHLSSALRRAIVMFYCKCGPNGKNAGDVFNNELAKFFLGCEACDSLRKSNMLAVGSILDFAILSQSFVSPDASYVRQTFKIWGSGFTYPLPDNAQLCCDIDVYAVRGYSTLSQLRKLTGELFENVVIGDPGLLASYLFTVISTKDQYEGSVRRRYYPAL